MEYKDSCNGNSIKFQILSLNIEKNWMKVQEAITVPDGGER